MAARVAVIAAAGAGNRFGGKKQFAELNGRTVLWHALQPFLRAPDFVGIYVVVNPDDEMTARNEVAEFADSVQTLPTGGATRAVSVLGGLAYCEDADEVFVHDAARPCLSDECLARLVAADCGDDGALLALPVGDALKTADSSTDGGARVADNVSRAGLWAAQTPQRFKAGILRAALRRFPAAADEAEAVLGEGHHPLLVPGDSCNIKITHDSDLFIAAQILRHRDETTV